MTHNRLEQRLLDTTHDAFLKAGNWLSSTLALLPLFLLTLSLGLERIPPTPAALAPTAYLWMAGFIVVLWFASSLMGDFDPMHWPSFGPIPGIWSHLAIIILMLLSLLPLIHYSLEIAVPGNWAGKLILGTAFCIVGIVVGAMTEQAAGVKTGEILALGLGCISVLATVQTVVIAVVNSILTSELFSSIGVMIAFVAVVCGTVFVLILVMTTMQRLEKYLALNEPSWQLRLSLAVLLLAYFTIIWYCLGNGWQAFS